jgi:exodeoxyribonuclease III
MPDFPDEHARLIQGEISLSDKSCLIINGYMPNGNPVSSDKFPYKLAWLRALVDYVRTLRDMNVPFILCGDFNIIPTDFDVHNPDEWRDDALFRKESVALYRELLYMGLTDTVRFFNPHTPCYSFWDYQARAREKNHGIRIDHILPSPDMMDYAVSASVLDMYRDAPKASDHAPVILELQF